MDLEFLGKDSMLFKQTICFAKYDDVGKKVYTNIKSFIGKKKSNQDVFDKLTPSILNAHLSGIMPGLSAKVFRTYNASYTLEKELPDEEQLEGMSVADKVVAYNAANRKVAILCNHQKTVSKGAIEGLESMNEMFENLKQQRAELVKMKARIDAGKQLKKLKEESDQSEKAKAAVEKAKEMTAKATTSDEKIAATQQKEKANEMRKAAGKAAKEVAHLFTRQPTSEQVSKRIEGWDNKIKKLEVTIRNKDENKEVAWALPKSTTWILVYLWRGANETKCRLTRYSRRHCGTSSRGQWQCRQTGSFSNAPTELLRLVSHNEDVGKRTPSVIGLLLYCSLAHLLNWLLVDSRVREKRTSYRTGTGGVYFYVE